MSYAQWSQYTSYIVGDEVISASVLYVCILAVGPTATAPAADPTHWTAQGSPSISLPSGRVFMNGLVWTQDATSTYWTANITNISASLTATSIVGATLELRNDTSQAYTDSAIYWLAATKPSASLYGSIKVVIPSALSPQLITTLTISWFVLAF